MRRELRELDLAAAGLSGERWDGLARTSKRKAEFSGRVFWPGTAKWEAGPSKTIIMAKRQNGKRDMIKQAKRRSGESGKTGKRPRLTGRPS